LKRRGIHPEDRLFVSDRAHAVFPYHRALDESREVHPAGGPALGTTRRGIGPAYADKANRIGLRMGDLLRPDFPRALQARIGEKNKQLAGLGAEPLDPDRVLEENTAVARRLAPFITDTVSLLNRAMANGESVLFEGAQGTMLDIDCGTYPFVTSSSTISAGACIGAGVPPRRIDRVIGVIKAYTTRVGEGPFPTELRDAVGEQRRHHRPAPPLRLVRRGGRALRGDD
jgi:adenylosuccinate synthase